MICPYCNTPVTDKKCKTYSFGSIASAASMDNTGAYSSKFHTDCFVEWRENIEKFYMELDLPMNACSYFVRTGSSMHGYYVRENKKHPVLAEWNQFDISGFAIFPTMVKEMKLDMPYIKITIEEPRKLLESFQQFLIKNGWLNEWFAWRKPIEYKDGAFSKHVSIKG